MSGYHHCLLNRYTEKLFKGMKKGDDMFINIYANYIQGTMVFETRAEAAENIHLGRVMFGDKVQPWYRIRIIKK